MSDSGQNNSELKKSAVFFEPYKGEFYGGKESILSKKVLVVGASHYCQQFYECGSKCGVTAGSEKCPAFTFGVFDTFYSATAYQPWMRTYAIFANSFYGYDASFEEQCKLYQSVTFMNYLQRAEGKNGNEKHNSWFRNEQNARAFKETVAECSPEIVIVWGVRVWRALPWRDFIIDEENSSDNVKKCCCQGKSFMLLHAHHPSIGYDRETHLQMFRQNGIFIMGQEEK